MATIVYSGAGARSMPKERIEVFCGGSSWVLDDFRTLTSYTSAGVNSRDEKRVDKGHSTLMRNVLGACRGTGAFEPGLGAAYAAQSVALAALEAIATGATVAVQTTPG